MNYIENKYIILDQIKVYFPDNINNFVDLFCGGLDVTINIETKNKFALSNVLENKGKENTILYNWCKNNNYNIHGINFDYNK